MVIEPHMKQGRQHKLISTIFLATSVTKKLDHNTRINLDHVDKICEVLECDISDLIEYVPNQHKITGKDLIVEEHGNRKPKKKQ